MIEMTNGELWKWLLFGNIPIYFFVAVLVWGNPLDFLMQSLDRDDHSLQAEHAAGFDMILFLICCVALIAAEYQIATRFFVTIVPF